MCVKIRPKLTKMNSKGEPKSYKRRPRDGQDVQKASKKRPGGAKLNLLVFYIVFKRLQSPGGMRSNGLITYRLGRLTELNITKTNLLSTLRSNP